MDEQTMTAGQLLALYETTEYPGATILIDGVWLPIGRVCTDAHDDSQPVYLDIANGGGRRLLHVNDEVTVRGLPEPA